MFRPIRKKHNEISTDKINDLLTNTRRGVLAVNGDNDYPYAIPLNYYYDEKNQRILFHSSHTGYKIDAIKNCDKVCFTVFGNETVKEESWAPYVQSVVVFGRCRLIEDQSMMLTALKQFAMKYYPDEEMVDKEISISKKAVQMYEIEIEHLSGKEVQER